MRIGIIADTHLPSLMRSLDELGPSARELLSTVELILHAGDVIAPSVVAWCEQFAPIRIARGNNDLFEHPDMHDRHVFEQLGWRIGLTHELRPESRPIATLLEEGFDGEKLDIMISGDTHVQRLELREDVVFINPGSPTLPHHKESRLGTAAIVELSEARIDASIIALGETPGRPNPGHAQTLTVERVNGRKQLR